MVFFLPSTKGKGDAMQWYKVYPVLLALIISGFFIQSSFADPAAAKNGDKVSIEYTGTLSDGTVFDSSSKHNAPMEFEMGAGRVIPGFEKAIKGMKLGEEKKFTIPVAEAYGEANPKLIQVVPRSEIPQDHKPKVGMGILVGAPGEQPMRAFITKVTPNTITLDMNHPLAGKALTFEIKVVKITN
jgi:FKBP-type peptidyl-prolyl cis-trans isomerase 2